MLDGLSSSSEPSTATRSKAALSTQDPLVVVDVRPERIRRPLDLFILVALAASLVLLAALGSFAGGAGLTASKDLSEALRDSPHAVVRLLRVLGLVSALGVPLALTVTQIAGGRSRRLIEALATGVAAIGVVEALDQGLALSSSRSLYLSLTQVGGGETVRPLDAYLAALMAFLTVLELPGHRRGRRLVSLLTVVYVLSTFAASRVSLLSLLSSLGVGMSVGVLVRYVAGRSNSQPDATQIADELARNGIRLTRLERVGTDGADHRTYAATRADAGQLTVHVLDRDLVTSGTVPSLYQVARLRREVAPTPALSLEHVAERRALLCLAARAAGVDVPDLVAALPCGPDSIVLAYEVPAGTPLLDPDDAQLAAVWACVDRLHRARVTHRGLTAGQLRIGAAGQVLLPIPADGTTFASDLRISLDRAQLLVTCAVLADPASAVRGARTVLRPDELAAVLPLLQPLALTRPARESLVTEPGLLEALREEVKGAGELPSTELARVERVRPRTILAIVAAIVAGYLIVGQVGATHLTGVLATAHWQWVPLVLLASAATYLAAALCLVGSVRERLSLPRTVVVQLAASFAGFVTPPAVGGIALNVRYLRKARLSTVQAATSVGTAQIVNAASHVVLLVGFAAATGTSSPRSLPIPGWAFVLLGSAALVAVIVGAVPTARRAVSARVLPSVREALPRLADLVASPRRLSTLVSGSLLLNAAYIAALWTATLAFNAHLDVVKVAVVYLAGAAISSLAPTPGGLGAIELALSTGLTAAGMPGSAAVSAVLLYRLATFWLPVPLGWIALNWLQRRDLL